MAGTGPTTRGSSSRSSATWTRRSVEQTRRGSTPSARHERGESSGASSGSPSWRRGIGCVRSGQGRPLRCSSPRRSSAAGGGVAAAWGFVPGHEIISGPIDGIGGLIRTLAGALHGEAVTAWLGSLGPPLLGIALVLALFYALAKVGNWRWHDWDRRERILFRPEEPIRPDRRRVAAQAIVLGGGWLALAIAVWTGSERVAFAAWTAAAILGLLRWAVSE